MVEVGNDILKILAFIHTFGLLCSKLNKVKCCEFTVLKFTNSTHLANKDRHMAKSTSLKTHLIPFNNRISTKKEKLMLNG